MHIRSVFTYQSITVLNKDHSNSSRSSSQFHVKIQSLFLTIFNNLCCISEIFIKVHGVFRSLGPENILRVNSFMKIKFSKPVRKCSNTGFCLIFLLVSPRSRGNSKILIFLFIKNFHKDTQLSICK